jgi:hypothetical protein
MKKITKSFRIHLLFPFFLGGACIFSSCIEKIVNCDDPAPTFIRITLVDKNDSLLIGTKYFPDSIHLTVNNEIIPFSIGGGSVWIYYSGLEVYNNDNYLLYLSKDDTDTLNLRVYSYHTHDCGNYYDFGGLKYNFRDISPGTYDHTSFKVIKD